MSDSRPRSDLVGEVRLRVPLPIVIPLVALIVIAGIAIGFSQILLNVEKDAAVAIALVMATNILGATAFITLRPEAARRSWPELLIVVLYPVIIGLVIVQTGLGTSEAEGEHAAGAEQPAAAGGVVSITASGVVFDTDTITLKADEEATIEFDNQDAQQHNVAIYEDDSAAEDIFVGDLITGPEAITYTFTAPSPGSYYFQCDVHPSMKGTVEVE